jgi:carbonic anhydrase/acetyltransferase-like protein (isoleucine patch superfamily)
MSNSFEVVTDNSGRINYYVPAGFSDTLDTRINPEEIAQWMNGSERIKFKGVEYDLYENGCLVYPDIDFIDSAFLDGGVKLGPGTTFEQKPHDINDMVEIGNRARIEGAKIGERVKIGRSAVILAQSIGARSVIGDHSKIGECTEVLSDVEIGNAVKIDRLSVILNHAKIEDAVKLGYRTTVGKNSIIGPNSKIGSFTSDSSRYANGGGITIAHDKIIRPNTNI